VRREDVWYRWGEPDKRRELEELLAALGGVASGHVLVHLPPLEMAEKPADVRVETTDKAIVRLDEWDRSHSGRVAALNEAHRRLWRVAVYTHPSVSDEDRRLVRLAAEHELGVRSRYVDETDDRYLEAVFDPLAEKETFTAADRLAIAAPARGAAHIRIASLAEAEERVRALVKARRGVKAATPSPRGRKESVRRERKTLRRWSRQIHAWNDRSGCPPRRT
jgi:HD associated region